MVSKRIRRKAPCGPKAIRASLLMRKHIVALKRPPTQQTFNGSGCVVSNSEVIGQLAVLLFPLEKLNE